MDWLTILWVAIIVASVIFILALEGYVRRRRNNRRLGLVSDFPIGNFTDSLSSEKSLKPNFGGGSGGGAGATRSFAASANESAGVSDDHIITANSIVNGELIGDRVENRLPSADTISNIIEPTAAAVEFITDAAGNAIEAAGEIAEVAGEIVSEIISNN